MKHLLLIFILFSFHLFGQTFKGEVIDIQTNKAVPFSTIYFKELETGTIADSTGAFFIEHFNQNEIHLLITAFGYEKKDTIVSLHENAVLKIYLSPSHLDLEEVTITASTGKLEGDNVVSIEKRKLEELYQNAPLSLAEAISNIPGVDQNTTGAGIGKPIIRGLSGNRIVTYAQEIRVENQQWGSEHGLGIGSIGIEGVEVIKGPASLLYGSDALGGVLYFIDERYANHNTVEVKAKTSFQSNTMGSINQVGFKIHKKRLKFNLFGAYTSHADYQTPSFKNVYNTRFDEKSIKAAIGYNRKNWISNIRYSFLENNFGIVEDSIYTRSFDRNFILPFQKITNHSLSFSNKIFMNTSSLQLILGFTSNNRKEFEDNKTEEALGFILNTGTYNLKWKSREIGHLLNITIGSQGMLQTNKNTGEEILIPDGKTQDIGVFSLFHFKWSKLQIQAGFRIDSRQVNTLFMQSADTTFLAVNKQFIGQTISIGGNYKWKKTIIRANVSSGFRAPNTSELVSNGVHEGTNRYEIGNEDLKNENAIQMDLSVDYQSDHFSLSFNPFYNSISNYIFLSPTGATISSNSVYEYIQTDAFLYGGEFGVHYHPHLLHWLHLQSEFSTVFAEDKQHRYLPLVPQTRINSTIAVEFKNKGRFHLEKVFLQYIYKFKQDRIGQFETYSPSYNIVNIGLQAQIETKQSPIKLSIGVKNLFNTRYIDHLSRFKTLNIPNQGINFYAGISYVIGKKL